MLRLNLKLVVVMNFLNIFTTRPDTIYGATFIGVSVNHPLVSKALDNEYKRDKR